MICGSEVGQKYERTRRLVMEHTWALQCLFLGVAEHIHHGLKLYNTFLKKEKMVPPHHPPLGVRVPHPEPHTRPAGDDLVGHVAVAAHTVPHHGHGDHHLHPSRGQLVDSRHHSSSGSSSALVSRHARHDPSSLASANLSKGLVGV